MHHGEKDHHLRDGDLTLCETGQVGLRGAGGLCQCRCGPGETEGDARPDRGKGAGARDRGRREGHSRFSGGGIPARRRPPVRRHLTGLTASRREALIPLNRIRYESFEKYPHFVIPAPYQVRGKLRRETRGQISNLSPKTDWIPAPVPDLDPGFAGMTICRISGVILDMTA